MVEILGDHDYLLKYNRRTHKHMSQIHLGSSADFARASSCVDESNHYVLSQREIVEVMSSDRGMAGRVTACHIQHHFNLWNLDCWPLHILL